MPVSFKKKDPQPAPQLEVTEDDIPFDTDEVDIESSGILATAPVENSPQNGASLSLADRASRYIYTPSAARQIYDQVSGEGTVPWRYRMAIGEKKKVTFLDGDIDEETTFFKNRMLHEHTVNVGGRFPPYVCTERAVLEEDREPCPICAADRGPYLVCFFTVIDHTGYINNRGKRIANVTRVYAAKRRTTSKLLDIAAECGGLAGARFDISRLDGEANTGETFRFIKKFPVDKLCEKYKTHIIDPDYVTNYCTRAELQALGIGGVPIGAEGANVGTVVNIDDEL